SLRRRGASPSAHLAHARVSACRWLPAANWFAAPGEVCGDGNRNGERGRGGQPVPGDAHRRRAVQMHVQLHEQPADRLVQPSHGNLSAEWLALRRHDVAATRGGARAGCLSREGYQKVTDIMNGDEVLKNAGGGRTGGRQGGAGTAAAGRRGGGVRFGLDEYYIALLGTPSATAAWMIQFGGHHLAINVTVVGPNTVM